MKFSKSILLYKHVQVLILVNKESYCKKKSQKNQRKVNILSITIYLFVQYKRYRQQLLLTSVKGFSLVFIITFSDKPNRRIGINKKKVVYTTPS